MLKKFFTVLIFIMFMLIPLDLGFKNLNIATVSQKELAAIIKDEGFVTIDGKQIYVITEKEKLQIAYSQYIDFSSEGYYITYDKMGSNLELFYQNKPLYQWKNKYKYPRISYPYLMLYSSDMSNVDVYHLKDSLAKPATTLFTKDMITSWASSKKGEYLILGDIGGNYYIYNHANKKTVSNRLSDSSINYVKGVAISKNGDYLVHGSLYPEILISGNIQAGSLKAFEIPDTGRKKRKMIDLPHNIIIQKDEGVFILDKSTRRMTDYRTSYTIYDGSEFEFNQQTFLVLLFKQEKRFKVDFFIGQQYYHSVFVENPTFPLFKENKKNIYIIWNNGAIKI